MGFYSRHVFPHVMDMAMSSPEVQSLRRKLLAGVSGEIFEIGFGTGLNIPHYPKSVSRITTVDPNPGARKLALRRIAQSAIEVIHHTLGGEQLPLPDESFDTIVCTFTMCS